MTWSASEPSARRTRAGIFLACAALVAACGAVVNGQRDPLERPPIRIICAATGWSRPNIDPVDYHQLLRERLAASGLPIDLDGELFYDHVIGRFPRFMLRDGEWIERNGGIPQRIDMNAHLARIATPLARRGIDAQYGGWIILDFEGTHPLMRQSNAGGQRAAIEYTRQRYPREESEAEIRRLAAQEWDKSYREMMLLTVRKIRSIAPRARLALWNWPFQSDDVVGDLIDQRWLVELMDAYAPALYFGEKIVLSQPRRGEATFDERIAGIDRKLGGVSSLEQPELVKPVIPFVNVFYGPKAPEEHGYFVTDELDLRATYHRAVHYHGVDTFFLWHAATDEDDVDAFVAYLEAVLFPFLEEHFTLIADGDHSGSGGLRESDHEEAAPTAERAAQDDR